MNRFLHHDLVVDAGQSPSRWLVVLHGLLGAGKNWASVARKIIAASPGWGAILVDLREHGQSIGFPPPHNLPAAAHDVKELVEHLGLDARAVLGHSFGGKVAMQFAADYPEGLRHVFIADSTPDLYDSEGEAAKVLKLLRQLPDRFDSRHQAMGLLVSRGTSNMLAQWLTMSLVRDGSTFVWRMNLDIIGELLRDFQHREYWGLVENPGETRLHFVKATRADVLSPRACKKISGAGPLVFLHEIEGGHWLNVDNPAAVAALIAQHLASDSV